MTLEEYKSLPRIGSGEIYYIDPPRARPAIARSSPRRESSTWRSCGCCEKPTFVFRPTDRCVACTATIAWKVSLARQGLKIVWT
jgi:hypothetical protein